MRDAAYFRAQAELCRQLARHTSSADDTARALAMGARHLASAEALENAAPSDAAADDAAPVSIDTQPPTK